jgi:uncharacterized membrane protein YedE/YeeE
MKKPLAFVISTILSFFFMNISGAELTAVATYTPLLMTENITTTTDLSELLKLLFSTVGGIATTIILAWLRGKYPDLFTPRITANQDKPTSEEKQM